MKRISPSMIIAVVALVVSMSGGAYAATRVLITNVHQIGPGVRHQLRGARGPQGVPGPQGVSGASGAPGSQGLVASTAAFAGSFTEGTPVSISAGQSGTATEQCNSGFAATGGGFTASPGLVVSESRPITLGQGHSALQAWTTTASNPTGGTLTLQAWVACGAG